VGLTSEPQQKEAGPDTTNQEPVSDEAQVKINALRYVHMKCTIAGTALLPSFVEVQPSKLKVWVLAFWWMLIKKPTKSEADCRNCFIMKCKIIMSQKLICQLNLCCLINKQHSCSP